MTARIVSTVDLHSGNRITRYFDSPCISSASTRAFRMYPASISPYTMMIFPAVLMASTATLATALVQALLHQHYGQRFVVWSVSSIPGAFCIFSSFNTKARSSLKTCSSMSLVPSPAGQVVVSPLNLVQGCLLPASQSAKDLQVVLHFKDPPCPLRTSSQRI